MRGSSAGCHDDVCERNELTISALMCYMKVRLRPPRAHIYAFSVPRKKGSNLHHPWFSSTSSWMIALAKHSLPTSYKVQYHEGLKKQSFNSFQLISSGKQTLKWTNDTLYSREKHVFYTYGRARGLLKKGYQSAHAPTGRSFTSGGFGFHKSWTWFFKSASWKNKAGICEACA